MASTLSSFSPLLRPHNPSLSCSTFTTKSSPSPTTTLRSHCLSLSCSTSTTKPSPSTTITLPSPATTTTTQSLIHHHILTSLPKTPPPSVLNPIHHLLSTAPSIAAPAVCLAASELVGGPRNAALDVAAALHLMHLAAHAHDNLPVLRSSRAGAGAGQKPASMLLAHMGIHAFAYELIGGSSAAFEAERMVRVFGEMASVWGAGGVLEGQYLEAIEAGDVEKVRERREGRVVACAAACGAIVGGADEEVVEKMREVGYYVGMVLEGEEGREERFRSLAAMELEKMKGREVNGVGGQGK